MKSQLTLSLLIWRELCVLCAYSGPSNLRPLHLTIPSILRPLISNTTYIFSVLISLHFKTTSNLRPYFPGWRGGLKMQGPLYIPLLLTMLTVRVHCLSEIISNFYLSPTSLQRKHTRCPNIGILAGEVPYSHTGWYSKRWAKVGEGWGGGYK